MDGSVCSTGNTSQQISADARTELGVYMSSEGNVAEAGSGIPLLCVLSAGKEATGGEMSAASAAIQSTVGQGLAAAQCSCSTAKTATRWQLPGQRPQRLVQLS